MVWHGKSVNRQINWVFVQAACQFLIQLKDEANGVDQIIRLLCLLTLLPKYFNVCSWWFFSWEISDSFFVVVEGLKAYRLMGSAAGLFRYILICPLGTQFTSLEGPRRGGFDIIQRIIKSICLSPKISKRSLDSSEWSCTIDLFMFYNKTSIRSRPHSSTSGSYVV